ncbi:MAG: Type II secretion system protein G precursor [candidate division WS2 bacterium ADurb.Bin280]|uniref:Type II secretion system protein G n=1 Tax=candidate division WS2 bacterium ADurb.Bin280 TaxID=1852829 RepID=A0A1V5SF35_9BACT|nr:MAG: Type II secretion system protein G precursor [candidate division WS2 bacterium ADurb.Bin280]
MKKTIRAFTIVELLVVIVIIGILATIVTLNLTSSRLRASDRKAIANVNLLSGALDQYSISNGRKYPVLTSSPSTLNSEQIISGSSLVNKLKDYIDQVPVSDGKYNYVYLYNQTGSKAAILFEKAQSSGGTGICNYDASTAPQLVKEYKQAGNDVCYYSSK